MAASELKTNGATDVVFVELYGGRPVQVDENLVGISQADTRLGKIINRVKEERGRLSGFPDVLALFPDEHIIFREIKRHRKDSITRNQYEVADLLRKTFDSRADLAIVEWPDAIITYFPGGIGATVALNPPPKPAMVMCITATAFRSPVVADPAPPSFRAHY